MPNNVQRSKSELTFYYDLGDPEAYIVAEQLHHLLGVVPEWQPVLAANLPSGSCQQRYSTAAQQTTLEAKLAEYTSVLQQPLRWPTNWPFASDFAMLVATFAKQTGRVVAFSLAAFRQAFAGGHDLANPDTVLIAAAACELHPRAVLTNAKRATNAKQLANATAQAVSEGVTAVPTINIDGKLFTGVEQLNAAAVALQSDH